VRYSYSVTLPVLAIAGSLHCLHVLLHRVQQQDKAALNGKEAALALRETAVALSTHVITTFTARNSSSSSSSSSSSTTPAAVAAAQATALQAAAHALRGLQKSAAMCDASELPRTLDLLQGSEMVAAVLSRCATGEVRNSN
jgi:activator of HSP90 ATPase